jgi:hypothetical protein
MPQVPRRRQLRTISGPEATARLIDSVDEQVSNIRTRQLDISFNELADMYQSGELIVQPEYQRLFRWTEGAQSRFIETLILELPVPPIFLMETDENVYELIDGLQRISSYLNFRGFLKDAHGELSKALKLDECDIVCDLNGHTYDSLPAALSRKLKRNFIRAEILRKESDARLRYYMFKRLNSGGESLEPQEIRNCTIRLLNPDFNDELIRLSKSDDFAYCIGTVADTQKEKRYDQELVLRFFAFLRNSANYRHELGDFLTEYMETASAPEGADPATWSVERDRRIFLTTFRVLRAAAEQEEEKVGRRIFGSVDTNQRIRGQFAVYHYEGLALGIQAVLDQVNPEDAPQMKRLGQSIYDVKTDPALRKFTGGGKNTAPAYRDRVVFFKEKLESAV